MAIAFFDKVYQRAKNNPRRIVLPEGEDARVVAAAFKAAKLQLARIIILGNKEAILKKAKIAASIIRRVEFVDPRNDVKSNDYINAYWQLRQHKGLSLAQAKELLLSDYVFYAAMMVRAGMADGFVAGASHTTSDVARAALRCFDKTSGTQTASGLFWWKYKTSILAKAD